MTDRSEFQAARTAGKAKHHEQRLRRAMTDKTVDGIPDEVVEVTARALVAWKWGADWDEVTEDTQATSLDVARLALQTGLPHLTELATKTGFALGRATAAQEAEDLAKGVANPEKPYNEAFIHACGAVARRIREARP